MKLKWIRQVLTPLVLIAFAASILWTYISMKAESSEEQGKNASLAVIPEYEIISGKSLIAWPAGTIFPQGMASYFYASDPKVTATPVITISEMKNGVINGTIKSRIIVQAVDDKSQVYWQYQIKETKEEIFILSKGEENTADQMTYTAGNIVLDVPAAYDLITQIGNELMFLNGNFQLVISLLIKIDGIVNGMEVKKNVNQNIPLTLQQVSFSIPKSQDMMSQVTFQENKSNPGLQQRLFDYYQNRHRQLIVTLSLLILSIILLMAGNRNKSKAAAEHKRFKEWITEGSVEIKNRLQINILSLEGLVDLAIDLDKRVIYDSRIKQYYVLTEDIVYLYDFERINRTSDNRPQLGKLLIDRGLLKPEQLEIGLYYQKKIGTRLGESLTALGFIDETTLYSTLAAQQKTDYYELDPFRKDFDTDWLDKISIQQARSLMALPLGKRADGKLVIACGEASREGIQKNLQELFGFEITLVSTRPSAIYEILERMEENERQNFKERSTADTKAPYERLTKEELDQFASSYCRGTIMQGLLLKALGYLDAAILSQVPEQENILNWSVNRNLLSGEFANLIKGLDKAVQAMDWKVRQEKRQPGFLTMLLNANYITSETLEWINRELILQELPLDQLLFQNYIASKETIDNTKVLKHTIQSVLLKSPIEKDDAGVLKLE